MNYYEEFLEVLRKYYKQQLTHALITFWFFCVCAGLILAASIIYANIAGFVTYIIWTILSLVTVKDIVDLNRYIKELDYYNNDKKEEKLL